MNLKHSILLIAAMTFASFVSGQEAPKLFKGRNARQHSIIEPRDTTGISPFNTAARVELWHYNNRMNWWSNTFPDDRPLFKEGRLNFPVDSIQRRVVLDSTLSKGFYEALYVDQLCEESMVAACYSPRDLLVFVGADGRPMGCIEICVECAGGYVSDGLRSVVFCPERTSTLSYWLKRSYDPSISRPKSGNSEF